MNGSGLPGGIVVGLQSNIKLAIEKTGGVGAVIGTAKLRADDGYLRILRENVADLRRKLGGVFKRNRVGHGGANPKRTFIEVRQKFAADEGKEEQRRAKDECNDEESQLGMIEAPFELPAITSADAVEKTIGLFLDAVLEPIRGEDGNECERENEGANEGESHGVRHGMEKSSGGPSQRIDGEISGDDDGNGIEDGTINIASGGKDDVVDFVFLAMAEAEFAVDVFDHDDGTVNDDAEVDGADGKEVSRFAGGVKKNKSKEQS